MNRMLACLCLCLPLPAVAARWERLGPTGGRIAALVVAPSNTSVVYAAGAGVFRSADDGVHWTRCADVFPLYTPLAAAPRVTCLAVSPADAARVLAGSPQGLFLTTDAGASWRRAGTISVPIASVAFNADGRRAYASGAETMYRSADFGATWTASACPTMAAMCADPRGPTYMYGARRTPDNQGRTLCRTDDGAGWYVLPTASPPITALAPVPDGSQVYAATASGLYRVTRATWSAAIVHDAAPSALAPVGMAGWAHFAVNASTYQDVVYRTHNAGQTWDKLGTGLSWRGPISLSAAVSRNLLCGTERSGVMALDMEDTWRPSNAGLAMAGASAVFQAGGAGGPILAALPDGLYRSDDLGGHWVLCHVSSARSVAAASPAKPGRFYHTGTSGLARTEDHGRTWIEVTTGLPAGAAVARVVAHPAVVATVYAILEDGSLYRSTTANASWKLVLPAWPQPPAAVPDLHICAADPSTLYVVRPDGLYRSTDDGVHWSLRSACAADTRLASDPANADVLYRAATVGATVTVAKSADGGATWANVFQEAGAADSGFAAAFLAADARVPGRLLLGTTRGLRVRDTAASAWRTEAVGSMGTFCAAWAPSGAASDLLATDGAGVLIGRPAGVRTAADAAAVMQIAATGGAPTPGDLLRDDLNEDGALTPMDADLVLRSALGL